MTKEIAMPMRRLLLIALPLLLLALPVAAAGKVHHLALQISDNSPDKMDNVLNVAANVSRYYSEKGEEVEIRIVAFSGGLNMLRTDRSPVLEHLKAAAESLPNVTFEACANTRQAMARRENKTPEEIPLYPGSKVVPAGAVELLELNEQGWTILRP
jgi:intracellular sulfur oxidation DsrE/DsrF family protein